MRLKRIDGNSCAWLNSLPRALFRYEPIDDLLEKRAPSSTEARTPPGTPKGNRKFEFFRLLALVLRLESSCDSSLRSGRQWSPAAYLYCDSLRSVVVSSLGGGNGRCGSLTLAAVLLRLRDLRPCHARFVVVRLSRRLSSDLGTPAGEDCTRTPAETPFEEYTDDESPTTCSVLFRGNRRSGEGALALCTCG